MTQPIPLSESAEPPARGGWAWALARRVCWVRQAFFPAVLAGSLVHPVATLLSRYIWIADLFSHFREPGLAATILALVVAAFGKRFRVAAALAALATCQALPLTRYNGANPIPPSPDAPRPLRVLMVNVLHDNFMLEDIAALIDRERPDIVGLVEYTRKCQAVLESVREDYPYRVEFPQGPSGIALWFRRPPLSIDPPTRPIPHRNPFIHATFEYAGQPRHIWVVHPTSPFWRILEPGNPEVVALARRVAAESGSRIVVGDMNTTDGSAHFAHFLRVTGLRDSRLGFGLQRSWPTMFFYRLTIDHGFLSDDLAVVDRRLGPMVGSDHFPLILDLAPAARPATSVAHQGSRSVAPR